ASRVRSTAPSSRSANASAPTAASLRPSISTPCAPPPHSCCGRGTAPPPPPACRLLRQGYRSAAVTLMHSWLQPRHERAVAALLAELGFEHVSASADLSPTI